MMWLVTAFVITFILIGLVLARRAKLFSAASPLSIDAALSAMTHDSGRAEEQPQRRGLSDDDRDGFLHLWQSVRDCSSTDPGCAVIYADFVITDLMHDCVDTDNSAGSRTQEYFPQRVQENYLAAHRIATECRWRRPDRSELTHAIALYERVFDELLRLTPTAQAGEPPLSISSRNSNGSFHACQRF